MTPFFLFELGLDMARLGVEAQLVIAARMARLARGDAGAGIEAMRMVTEKALAMGEANAHLVSATLAGKPEYAGSEILALYGRKVRANRKRLARKR
jgi:hypothetical protein